jgi:hypothetical protein
VLTVLPQLNNLYNLQNQLVMNIEYVSSYPKRAKNGTLVDVFVYAVAGTKSELADYKKAKGEDYREDKETGEPLFYSLNYVGEQCPLIITTNGNVVADTSAMRKARNLVDQNPNLRAEVSAAMLQILGFDRVASGGSSKRTASTDANTASTETTTVTEENGADVDPFKG